MVRLFHWFLSLFRRKLPDRKPPEEAPIVYTDPNGVGWTRHPNWQDADAPDEGQHDCWKREMRVFLWRALHDHEDRRLDMRLVGLGTRVESVPNLFPVGMQLAEASRRLGFVSLAEAALPGVTERELRVVYDRHETSVLREAGRRAAHNAQTLQAWDPIRMGGPFVSDGFNDTVAELTLGSFERRAILLPLAISTPLSAAPAAFTRSR